MNSSTLHDATLALEEIAHSAREALAQSEREENEAAAASLLRHRLTVIAYAAEALTHRMHGMAGKDPVGIDPAAVPHPAPREAVEDAQSRQSTEESVKLAFSSI